MVERIGRARIRAPAAAALGAVSIGLLATSPAMAGGRDTTLQIRVEVIEPCRIRVLPGGMFDQACGGGQQPIHVSVGEMVADLRSRVAEQLASMPTMPSPPSLRPPAMVVIDPAPRVGAAIERANQVAASIAERVRYITLAY